MSVPSDRRPHDAAYRSAGSGARCWYRMEHILIICGLALVPWLVVLTNDLPGTAITGNWHIVWIGLDTLEALGLIATGLLAKRGHHLHPLTATAAATLLVVDAWFDTMTAAPGADRVSALVMAFCAELPLAVMCGVLAARGHARPAHTSPAVDGPPVPKLMVLSVC
ncbi:MULTISPECIES: hypothetical protein [unclassified Streptomyces]|uniref:hypothetical protein n=1 Tax=unclassified Streptomyces TaxID=2593676 RepID=UPI003D8CAE6D